MGPTRTCIMSNTGMSHPATHIPSNAIKRERSPAIKAGAKSPGRISKTQPKKNLCQEYKYKCSSRYNLVDVTAYMKEYNAKFKDGKEISSSAMPHTADSTPEASRPPCLQAQASSNTCLGKRSWTDDQDVTEEQTPSQKRQRQDSEKQDIVSKKPTSPTGRYPATRSKGCAPIELHTQRGKVAVHNGSKGCYIMSERHYHNYFVSHSLFTECFQCSRTG